VDLFFDIHARQINKSGEELCGDAIRVRRTDDRTVVVLSDGLGSGVKANILATMTAEIVVTMLTRNVSIEQVLDTVIGSLPECQVRLIAYATFTVIVADNHTRHCMIANFDNPPPVHLRGTTLSDPPYATREVFGRTIHICQADLAEGDFVALMSDGVPHAGLGATMDFGWGWENVAKSIGRHAMHHGSTARGVVDAMIDEVKMHYRGQVGDDASCVGLLVRPKRSLMLFTGPPLDPGDDRRIVERLLAFDGRKVVCGGTTGNIVARTLDTVAEVDIATMTPEVPPIAALPGIDLVTEGILTMNKALELIEQSNAIVNRLPEARHGAALLAREMLQADDIHLIVGRQINAYYQNPTLPPEVSLRKGLIDRYLELLARLHKHVRVEYV
jgi:hypothetical protein